MSPICWPVSIVSSDPHFRPWSGELWRAQYGGGVRAPFNEEQDPDLDTTDTVDLNADYQPPDTEEPEPAPPPDDTPPPDLTADTTPSPDSSPPSDTPPAEDPAKEEKTVEDYLGDGNLAPEGPGPEVPTSGGTVAYHLDKAGNRTSVTDDVNGNATYVPNNLNQYTSVRGSSVTNGSEHEIRTYNSVTYTYINDEHLKQVSSGSNNYYLYYDALGRCVKRVLNGATTYYIYDGEKPILEYRSTDLSHPAKNVYGKGIDEILMRYDPSFSPTVTYYYQQDHEGSVTHLLNTSGNVIEKYQYDAFGLPFIYDANGTQLSSSAYSNRFLFTGREYANLFGFYEYRARAYHPILGRFMSEDPKLFDAGDYNLFRYCHNDPVDLTDPMGLYAKGEGWTPDQWKKFDQAQQTASRQLEKAVNRIVLAREAGKESKEFKSLSKDFQKIFGKEATAENLSKVAHTAREMITALRDDGRNGHIANAMSSKEIMANFRGTDRDTMAVGVLSGTKIYVNLEHRSFGKASALSWAAGHESAHNVGLKHGMLNGVTAYKYGKEQERETYRMLPSVAPDEAIHNPDNFMDFAR
jgi:RHS repeat-associated protein